MIFKAGLENQLDFDERKIEPSVKQLVEKFNVLKGEICAGNDNALILSDIEKVIHKLREKDVIDDEKLNEIMNMKLMYTLLLTEHLLLKSLTKNKKNLAF